MTTTAVEPVASPAEPPVSCPHVLIVQPGTSSLSESFIRAHAERLPARVTVACGFRGYVDGRPIRSDAVIARAARKLARLAWGRSPEEEVTRGYLRLLDRFRPDAVLAEYGETGVMVGEACRRAGVPLVVHFHGYDASIHSVLARMAAGYRRMFETAAAVVAVSRVMARRLTDLGAPAGKVYWNPCGVDVTAFRGADPAAADPTFLAVGRFTAKKAPHLTLRAFATVRRAHPAARLRMIGFGPLEDECKALARDFAIADAVEFLGPCPPAVVQQEMRRARCFVQHSVQAPDGDSEGTPVSIIEACASGLPVVSTRHAGICDVVADGETGFLVAEHDVPAMADRMLAVARDPSMAARLGRAGQERVRDEFTMAFRIAELWRIIDRAIQCGPCPTSGIRATAVA